MLILDCYDPKGISALDDYCLTDPISLSAGPNSGSLLSVMGGITISMQIGFELMTLKKLHSFFVAAEAACSRGDLPVVAVEAMLIDVAGLATATAPTLLAAAVLELLKAANGAAHPVSAPLDMRMAKYKEVFTT